MNENQLERLSARLYTQTPLIGGMLRRRAAQALAEDGSPEAMHALAEAVAHASDTDVRDIALAALHEVHDARVINAICRIWAETRSLDLAGLLNAHQWVASSPSEARVLSALEVERLDMLRQCGANLVPALAQALDDPNPLLAARAQQVLHNLQTQEAREQVCRIVIRQDQPDLRAIALETGYLPEAPADRALYLFLTEQWARYENLDFDHRLLRAAYELADGLIRRRVRETLRRAGRLDYLTAIAGQDYRDRVAEMDDEELEFLLNMLANNKEHEKLWRLAFEAPFNWSVRIVHYLAGLDWQPEAELERRLFARIAPLARPELRIQPPELSKLFPMALLQAHARAPGNINAIAFAPRRQTLALGTGAQKVVLWNYETARREQVLDAFDHSIGEVAFLPDDTLLCAERTNRTTTPCSLYSWNGEEVARVGRHVGSITGLATIGASQALTTGRDQLAKVWDVPALKRRTKYKFNHWARALAVSADGARAALLHQSLYLIELRTKTPGSPVTGLHTLSSTTRMDSVLRCAAFTPDGEMILGGKYNGDLGQYRQVRYANTNHHWVREDYVARYGKQIQGIEMLADAGRALIGVADGVVHILALEDYRELGQVVVPGERLTSLHISPDAAFMAVGTSDAELTLWDLRIQQMPTLFTAPLAEISPTLAATAGVFTDHPDLAPRARGALTFVAAVLRHRHRFDIEIDTEHTPTIMMGEFDIEIE